MTARETVVPVLLEKVYKLIQDKLDLAHRPLVTQLAQHLFSNVSHDDLTQRNERANHSPQQQTTLHQ